MYTELQLIKINEIESRAAYIASGACVIHKHTNTERNQFSVTDENGEMILAIIDIAGKLKWMIGNKTTDFDIRTR